MDRFLKKIANLRVLNMLFGTVAGHVVMTIIGVSVIVAYKIAHPPI